MKKGISRLVSLFLAVALVVTLMPAVKAEAASNKGPTDYAYVMVIDAEGNSTYLYDHDGNNEVEEVAGLSYNLSKNTLTLNKFKSSDCWIEANCMGSDFKIKLVGTNELAHIRVWGDAYGGSLTLTGKGSLTVNKKKNFENAILLKAEQSKSSFTVDKSVTLKAYAEKSSGYSVYIDSSLYSKKSSAMVFKNSGSSSKKLSSKTYYANRWVYVDIEFSYNGSTYTWNTLTQIESYTKDGELYAIHKDGTTGRYIVLKLGEDLEVTFDDYGNPIYYRYCELVETRTNTKGYTKELYGYDFMYKGNLTLKPKK